MSSIILPSSGSSTVNPVGHSSSAQASPEQAVTEQSLARPASPREPAPHFLEKWVVPLAIPLVGAIIAGVIGYFSAIFVLKDDINANKTGISLANKEVDHVKEDVRRMTESVTRIPAIETEIAVIRTRLDMESADQKTK